MIKLGVDLRNLTPQMAIAYTEATWVYWKLGGYEIYITSGQDGIHKPKSGKTSLHQRDGLCRALDFRTKHLAMEHKLVVAEKLQSALGNQYYVELEHLGKDEEHLHCEFDPKEDI